MTPREEAQQIADQQARYGLPPYYYGRSSYNGKPPLGNGSRPPSTLTVEIGAGRFLFALPMARFGYPTPLPVATLLRVTSRHCG